MNPGSILIFAVTVRDKADLFVPIPANNASGLQSIKNELDRRRRVIRISAIILPYPVKMPDIGPFWYFARPLSQ